MVCRAFSHSVAAMAGLNMFAVDMFLTQETATGERKASYSRQQAKFCFLPTLGIPVHMFEHIYT